uniref:C-type lectin domain-containing protein n=1 Tax=Astyanax mexicanus TaxID=7994 RepID=A0A3B1JDU4_ASTMX
EARQQRICSRSWLTLSLASAPSKQQKAPQNLVYLYDKREYVFINNKKTWSEAQSYCREHYTDMASVRNENEREMVYAAGKDNHFWIGLSKDINNTWKWSDQSSSSFRYWNSNQPDNTYNTNCAAASVKDQGQWHNIECGEQRPFICHEI